MHASACKSDKFEVSQFIWINIITIICAFASLILESMQIIETFKILNKLKDVFKKNDEINKFNEESDTGIRKTAYDENLANLKKKNAKTNIRDNSVISDNMGIGR
jgi:hypothetical protein